MNHPSSYRLTCACFAACLVFLAACDSSPGQEERIGVSGHWTGELTYRNLLDTTDVQIFPVDLSLVDVVSSISGSGYVDLPAERATFTVSRGLFDIGLRTVTLTLLFDRPPQGSLSGIVSPERDLINGTMGGPGLVNGEVELTLMLR